MTDDEILAEFRDADALLEGHFILSSGLRSPRYLQCARLLMDPKRAERMARALAAKLPGDVRQSIMNLEVVQIDTERNLIAIKGSVPGANGGEAAGAGTLTAPTTGTRYSARPASSPSSSSPCTCSTCTAGFITAPG